MILKYVKAITHIILAVVLTITTQVGGLLYIICIFSFRRYRWKKYAFFLVSYLLFTFLLLPLVAPNFGREKIGNNDLIKPQSLFYVLANRNYVKPEINRIINEVSSDLNKKFPGVKLVYLDANFPFFDGFPLLPHLSHNDGKKLDLSLLYERDGEVISEKPSRSGYGVYEPPLPSEENQAEICANAGYWQYDFPKYLSLGRINRDLEFSEKGTKYLLQQLVKQSEISKIFIEPHLKTRLGIVSSKVRYHGCRAVRHDDHIHIQIL